MKAYKGFNKVRGGVGAILVIALERETTSDIIEWKAAIVDGVNIKANTWYCLKDGDFWRWSHEFRAEG